MPKEKADYIKNNNLQNYPTVLQRRSCGSAPAPCIPVSADVGRKALITDDRVVTPEAEIGLVPQQPQLMPPLSSESRVPQAPVCHFQQERTIDPVIITTKKHEHSRQLALEKSTLGTSQSDRFQEAAHMEKPIREGRVTTLPPRTSRSSEVNAALPSDWGR